MVLKKKIRIYTHNDRPGFRNLRDKETGSGRTAEDAPELVSWNKKKKRAFLGNKTCGLMLRSLGAKRKKRKWHTLRSQPTQRKGRLIDGALQKKKMSTSKRAVAQKKEARNAASFRGGADQKRPRHRDGGKPSSKKRKKKATEIQKEATPDAIQGPKATAGQGERLKEKSRGSLCSRPPMQWRDVPDRRKQGKDWHQEKKEKKELKDARRQTPSQSHNRGR